MIPEVFIKLLLAVLFGAIIGFEREYSSKAAGFRTITLVTLGSTLFTIMSFKMGTDATHDRIASNLIVGIGFIGAGVVFKDAFNISGLTTASGIWVSAAIGMAIGAGEFLIATYALLLSIVVLALFEKVQNLIDDFHQIKVYRISFNPDYSSGKKKVEEQLKALRLKFKIRKILRKNDEVIFFFNISGTQNILIQFSTFLAETPEVKSFEE